MLTRSATGQVLEELDAAIERPTANHLEGHIRILGPRLPEPERTAADE